MKKTIYKSATKHLQNFGFMVDEHEEKEEEHCYAEKDESALIIRTDSDGGLMFETRIYWTMNCHLNEELLLFLSNTLNFKSKCSSFTLLDDMTIGVKAVYMGGYSKEKFAEFLENWVWDTTELIFSDRSPVIMHLMTNSNELAYA